MACSLPPSLEDGKLFPCGAVTTPSSVVLPATTIGLPAAASLINAATLLSFAARTSYFRFPIARTLSRVGSHCTSLRASSSLCASHKLTCRSTGPHHRRTFIARSNDRSLTRAFTTITGIPASQHSCNMRGHNSLSISTNAAGFRP